MKAELKDIVLEVMVWLVALVEAGMEELVIGLTD